MSLLASAVGQRRWKMVRCQAYQRPGTSAPYGQSPEDRAHLGMRALAAEYVEAGQLLVKQRRYLSRNIHVTRRKHFKYYPGENVRVRWTTSLAAMVAGRIKYTHDAHRDIIFVNVLPEPREELLREELWRYRTEHVHNQLDNQQLCYLRQKSLPQFPRELVNPPTGVKPDKDRVGGRLASWNNPVIRDPLEIEPYPFALTGALLKKHLASPRVDDKEDKIIDIHATEHGLTSFSLVSRHPVTEHLDNLLSRGWGTPTVHANLTNHNGLQYFGKVYVGEPGQQFQVIFDTGSKDLWIPGPRCSEGGCAPHAKFEPLNSWTFARPEVPDKTIAYGTGKVEVESGNDTVRVCDESQGCFGAAMEAKKRSVGLATEATERPFRFLPFDGIFGLPPSQTQADLLPSMFKDAADRPHVMGFYFSKDAAHPGKATFGGVNTEHIDKTSPVSWHNLTKAGDEWTVELVDISVGGERLHICPAVGGCEALIDTGTSLVTGPTAKIQNLLSRLQPCEAAKTNPDIQLIFRGADGQEIPYKLQADDYELSFPKANKCAHGFGPLDVGKDRWVIGNTFLRRFYSIFDDTTKQVGFIKSRHFGEQPVSALASPLSRSVDVTAAIVADCKILRMKRWANFL